MNAPRTRRSPLVDLGLILCLILLLAGTAGLVRHFRSHGSKPAVQGEEPPGMARKIDPTWVHYRESISIPVPERQVRGVTVSPNDDIYVCAGFKVYEYLPNGKPVTTFSLDNAARCLTMGPNGKLYLGAGEHIIVLDPKTRKTTSWKSLGSKAFLTSVAVGGNTLFAGDAGNRLVWRYNLDGTRLGAIKHKVPETAEAVKEDVPSTYFDVAADPDGTFWVTDAGRHGVLHYKADGTYLGRWGKAGLPIADFSGCCNPTHLAMAPGHLIVTVEKKPDLVKVYHADGKFDCVVAGPKAFAPMTFIADVRADSKGRILVVDPKKRSVRIFVPKKA